MLETVRSTLSVAGKSLRSIDIELLWRGLDGQF